MFGKLVLVILSIGACGCALLAMRQSRLLAASELVRIQLQIRSQDEELWLLRTQIARKIAPDRVREMLADLGPIQPSVPDAAPIANDPAPPAPKNAPRSVPTTKPPRAPDHRVAVERTPDRP